MQTTTLPYRRRAVTRLAAWFAFGAAAWSVFMPMGVASAKSPPVADVVPVVPVTPVTPEATLIAELTALADQLDKYEPCGQAGRAMQRWLDRHIQGLAELIPKLQARVTVLTADEQAELNRALASLYQRLADRALRCGHHPTVQESFARFAALAPAPVVPSVETPSVEVPVVGAAATDEGDH